MSCSRWYRIVLAFGCLLCVSAAHAQIPELKVSVYNDASVPSDILARAESRAEGIFGHAGLHLKWFNCDLVNHPGHDQSDGFCNAANERGDFVLRIIPRGTDSRYDARFGVTFLGADGRGRYSDVFWDKVQALRANCKVNLSALLGNVMAHEIGHLVLGSHAHAISGIMKAQWENHELQQITMGTLLFLPGQEKAMRERHSSRLAITSH